MKKILPFWPSYPKQVAFVRSKNQGRLTSDEIRVLYHADQRDKELAREEEMRHLPPASQQELAKTIRGESDGKAAITNPLMREKLKVYNQDLYYKLAAKHNVEVDM